MVLKAYRGNKFEHTHENLIFNELHDLLESHCRNKKEKWCLLGNIFVGGRELDALLVKPNAITIIDFKDYGGKLIYSEEGPWRIDNVEVKGGSSINPLEQLRRNRRGLNDFFENNFRDLSCNWMHISAAVVFHKQIEFKRSVLTAPTDRWFHITDMNHVVRDLDSIVSNQINISPGVMESIISKLGIETFYPDEAVGIRRLVKAVESKNNKDFQLTRKQIAALQEFTRWLKGGKRVFRLAGMVSTGKKTLLPSIADAIKEIGLTPLILLPNTRHAFYYHNFLEGVYSIYTWLYTQQPVRFEEFKDRKLAIHEINKDLLVENIIPIIMDGHLFSDEEFEVRYRRYGSGRLITDFLETLSSGCCRFVVIGDPYQLTKGSLNRSFMAGVLLEQSGFTITEYTLDEQVLAHGQGDALAKFQAHLVESIEKKRFNYLPQLKGSRLNIIGSKEKYNWVPDLINAKPESLMTCGTHEQVKYINISIKKDMLHHDSIFTLGPQDRIDFYNRTPILLDDNLDYELYGHKRWVNIGDIGIVDSVDETIETVEQLLKGRDAPFKLKFQKALCRIPGLGQVKIRYLLNFLESERPELDPDLYIALQVIAYKKAESKLDDYKKKLPIKKEDWSKSDREHYEKYEYLLLQGQGYLSAALIRLSHAMTVHRAQGRKWPMVWVKAERSASSIKPNNADFYRWLYTASVCAEDEFCILHMPYLDPLIDSVVSRAKDFSIANLKIKKGLFHNSTRQPNEQEKLLLKPTGFRDNNLLALYLELYDRLEGSSWEINNWQEFDFQVVITFKNKGSKNEVKIRMHYNKKYTVNNIVPLGGLESDQQELIQYISGKFQPDSDSMAEAIDALEKRIAGYGFKICGGSESNYRVLLSIAKEEETLEVEVNANKEGMVSSIRLLKSTSDILAKQFEEAVVHHENLR